MFFLALFAFVLAASAMTALLLVLARAIQGRPKPGAARDSSKLGAHPPTGCAHIL